MLDNEQTIIFFFLYSLATYYSPSKTHEVNYSYLPRKDTGPPQYLSNQLTLFEPGRADYPHLLLLAPPKFFTFRQHCKIRKKSQFSQKWICIYFLKILSLEKNDAPVLIFNLEHPVLF